MDEIKINMKQWNALHGIELKSNPIELKLV